MVWPSVPTGMLGFQTLPKSKQNGSDFRQCLKFEPFGNGTIMQMFEIQTFIFQMFTVVVHECVTKSLIRKNWTARVTVR